MTADLFDSSDDSGPDDAGWFKCHRKIINSQVFADAELLRVFVWLMARSSFRPHWVTIPAGRGTKTKLLQPDQSIVGRHMAGRELGVPASTFWRRLQRLAELESVKIDSDTNCSVVTLTNWPRYQNDAPQVEQHSDSIRTPFGHLEKNEENEENDKNERSLRPKQRFEPADRALADHIWSKVLSLQPTRKPPDLNRWANTIRLAREADGRTLAGLRDVFDRAHADTFWRINILSPDKLREKFDDLDLKLRKEAPHVNGNRNGHSTPARIRTGEYADPGFNRSTEVGLGR